MDLNNNMRNLNSNTNTNNRLSKKLQNIKINYIQEELNSKKFNESKTAFYNDNGISTIEDNKTKVMKMIILDEENNILTRKYKLVVCLNKNIIKLPFNLDPYTINFVSISDLSQQILNKLKTNNSNDINHYENLCFTSSVSFYDENMKRRLTDINFFKDNNDILICKLGIPKVENSNISKRNSDLDSTISKINKKNYLDKYDYTYSNKKEPISKNNSEIKLNQSINKNKSFQSRVNREFKNRDIELNDYIKDEKNSFLQKLNNNEGEINNEKHKLVKDKQKQDSYLSKDVSKFENRLNKSDSESYYTLTNRSFYNKIKPKNVEIIIRDSEKKKKEYSLLNNKSDLGSTGEKLDFQYHPPENSSKFNRNASHSIFYIDKTKSNSINSANKTITKTTDEIDKCLVRSEYNFNLKKNKNEKNPSDLKTKSTYSSLNSETADNFIDSKCYKLPIIQSKYMKFEEMSKEGKYQNNAESPKFVNLFDNKKEANSLFRKSLLNKKFKLTNEKIQITSKNPLKFYNNFHENSNADVLLPNINHNNTKSVIFNSIYKSFDHKYNARLSLSEIDYDTLLTKNKVYSNIHTQNSKNQDINSKSFRKGKIYPAKLLIKSNDKAEDMDSIYNISDLKASHQLLNSKSDIKIMTLKKLNCSNKTRGNNSFNSKEIRKTIEFMNKRIKKPNKHMQLTKHLNVLKNILEIDNNDDILNNKTTLSVCLDKDRNNIDEINENCDFESELFNKISNSKVSNKIVDNKLDENQNHKIFLGKVNRHIYRNQKEDDCESNKRNKKVFSLINKSRYHNKKKSNIENNCSNFSFSESFSYMNKSIISDYEADLKQENKRDVYSYTEHRKFDNKIEKVSDENKTRNINNFPYYMSNENNRNSLNNPNYSTNFSCGVNFNAKEDKNFDNYYLSMYEETQKIKFKINSFIKNDLTKLINNKFLEEKFKGIVFHEKSEFDYQTKREFLFYTFVSSKFVEKINFKKNSLGNFSLPDPGDKHKIVHIGVSTISLRIIKNESEINYDIYRKSKNNYFKLIQEYNQVIEEILNRLRKNIAEIIRYFSSLNCLKINNIFINYHFFLIYILRNDNIFSDKKIVFKLLEFITKDNSYAVNYSIFRNIKRFSFENSDNFTKENYFIHVNFIRLFLKFYLGEEKQRDNITRILDEFKYSLGINDFDITSIISEDLSDLNKNAEIYNIRIKIANIYLILIRLLS